MIQCARPAQSVAPVVEHRSGQRANAGRGGIESAEAEKVVLTCEIRRRKPGRAEKLYQAERNGNEARAVQPCMDQYRDPGILPSLDDVRQDEQDRQEDQ